MNERIRELHREAEKWVADNFSTDELNPYEWWEKEEQKFAELIISDCIAAVEDTNDRYRKEYFVSKIKERFGVE